jgi:hypothetical protein
VPLSDTQHTSEPDTLNVMLHTPLFHFTSNIIF